VIFFGALPRGNFKAIPVGADKVLTLCRCRLCDQLTPGIQCRWPVPQEYISTGVPYLKRIGMMSAAQHSVEKESLDSGRQGAGEEI